MTYIYINIYYNLSYISRQKAIVTTKIFWLLVHSTLVLAVSNSVLISVSPFCERHIKSLSGFISANAGLKMFYVNQFSWTSFLRNIFEKFCEENQAR